MIWNETKECMSRDEIETMQSARLVKVVNRVYHNVPYYRNKMQQLGLEPGDIHGLEDLHKLPFTTYEDLRDTYPFGLAAVPKSEVVRLHASSGTTGKPKIAVYTRRDIDIWAECVARCMTMIGITREDVIQVAYGYGLFTGGLGAHYGAEEMGALVIPMSTGNTQKLITMMIDCEATAIACTPSYLLHVAETLKAKNLLDKVKLKYAICGAEPWTDSMRKQMEDTLGIKAYDIYGLTEICGPGVATDCQYHKGLHIWEDHFLPEIIDPVTMEQTPNESGELVITTLTKEGMPLIRYRTKDLTSIDKTKCECGRTMARIQRFKGRTDDMLIIKGVNVFPSQVEEAVLNVPGVTAHYMMLVDRIDNEDSLEVQVEVENTDILNDANLKQDTYNKVRKEIRRTIGLHADITLLEPNALEHSQGKTKHVTDNRKLYQ
ncbi:MAG: phenylacetate--CoA ligase [Eubacterium sp.]|nr:phenylacetate--CoA ligase [Eubacterium sp.]